MEINAKETFVNSVRTPISDGAAKDATVWAEKPKVETAKPNTDVTRPTPANKRPPPVLAHAVSQGLTQSGLLTADTSSVPAANGAEATATSNDLEKAQNEKVSQAMQAFMHALVQATASRPQQAEGRLAKTEPNPVSETSSVASGPAGRTASEAYAGLTSRLEALARQLEGSSAPGNSNPGLENLSRTFRDLALATGATSEAADGSPPPKLQEVVRAVARNLQSTGDPTLATSGNVINTSA